MKVPTDSTDSALSFSACVLDADTGDTLVTGDAGRVRSTASIGKVLLLIEVARRLGHRELDPATPLARTHEDVVADSGLWQHLHAPSMAVADLAVLVGAVSDNLATNVLLRRVGLPSVTALSEGLGLAATRLHDQVRDERRPQDPPTLSTGTAAELAALFSRLHLGQVIDQTVSATVLGWLNLDTDLSLAAGAFGLDPLAHHTADRDWWLAHKTGTDTGVRADVGLIRGPMRAIAYAVLAEFDDADRDAALATMRGWGRRIRELAE